MTINILVLGASYGSLFSTKALMAGHDATLVCTGPTAELINREGTVVRMPIKGRDSLLDISSKKLSGKLSASTPEKLDPAKFELVVLGMQEAQYGAPGVRELMGRVASARAVPGDHEHAAAAVSEADSGSGHEVARALLRRSESLGRIRSRALTTLGES